MNKCIAGKDIESVIKKKKKNYPQTKSPDPDGFSGEFYWTFKENR